MPAHNHLSQEHTGNVALERVLAWPPIDRALGWLLNRPAVLQGTAVLIGVAVVALALRPLIWPSDLPAPAGSPALPDLPALAAHAPVASPAVDSEAAVLSVVAAYNQASITAAVLGRADVLAPYLAPASQPWAAAQAEYQRRATRAETHDPSLIRWGVLRVAVQGDAATVETQEQWDDTTSVGGQLVSSRRGILTRNTYTLRRAPDTQRWHITDVATTTLIH